MKPDRPETYDEANARMSRTLGERAEGSIRGMGANSAKEAAEGYDFARRDADDFDPVASVQGVSVGGITFRSEPPDAIQFIVDEQSKTVTMRLAQGAGEGEADAIAGATDDPFSPTPSATDPEVTFEPGIITNAGQNISPTVGGGSTMATVPRPALTITTSGTIYLEATVDAAGLATAIDTKNAATTPTDTTTLKHLELASVTLASGAVTVTARPVRESRPLYLCNGTAIWH